MLDRRNTPQTWRRHLYQSLRRKHERTIRLGVGTAAVIAENPGFAINTFTHSFTNYAILLFQMLGGAASETYRTLEPDGIAVIASVLSYGRVDVPGVFKDV
jgi:hypothetical protein